MGQPIQVIDATGFWDAPLGTLLPFACFTAVSLIRSSNSCWALLLSRARLRASSTLGLGSLLSIAESCSIPSMRARSSALMTVVRESGPARAGHPMCPLLGFVPILLPNIPMLLTAVLGDHAFCPTTCKCQKHHNAESHAKHPQNLSASGVPLTPYPLCSQLSPAVLR